MHTLTLARALARGGALAALAAASVLLVPAAASQAAQATPSAPVAQAAPASAAISNSGSCHTEFVPPRSWIVVCGSGSGSGGGGGKGGSGHYTCTLQYLSKAQQHYLGLPKPPKGEKWAVITCPGHQPFGGVTLVSADGTPAVTPQELLQVALSELQIPVLHARTAPPATREGLVGLPEWYWIPSAWRPINVEVSAGPVWARVTATPEHLAFQPGGGLTGDGCRGPGTPYAAGRHTSCSYQYTQSSFGQPGGKYAATVVVTWKVIWTGSGGTGAVLNNALPVPSALNLRIAEGQALVTGSGVGQ
ncbi:MAG TPA: hypothetical protein VGG25_12635 [Streptosporangiaceae bacterium]